MDTQCTPVEKEECSIVLWNTHGSSRFREIKDFLKGFDVVILQETWLDEKKAKNAVRCLDTNFKYWVKSAIKKKMDCRKGRLSGGQIIGVKKSKLDGWVTKEWEFGMIVIYRKELCIITIYNNIGMSNIEFKLRCIIEECMIEYDSIFICGDLNSRIGEEQVFNEKDDRDIGRYLRKSEDKVLNDNGRRLISLCEELGLILLNGRTSGDEDGKMTFVGGDNLFEGSVIDLVLMVDRDNLNVVKKLKIIERIESDHLPVAFQVNMNVVGRNLNHCSGMKKNCKREKIIWKNEKSQEFREKIRDGLRDENCEEDNHDWSNVKSLIWGAAREAGLVKWVGGTQHLESKSFIEFTEECEKIRKEVWASLREWLKDKNPRKKEILKECRNRLRKITRREKREWINDKWEEINKARDASEWWKAIRKFRAQRGQLVDNDIDEKQWIDHFEKLLTKGHSDVFLIDLAESPWLRDIDISQDANDNTLGDLISIRELKKAISRMADGKATGEDEIPIECLKILSSEDTGKLLMSINKVWEEGILPLGWEKARIVPLFKEGNVNEVGNYRGISLLDSGYKVLTNIMASRLNEWTDKENKLKESQAGFRKSRGTRDHIFVLNSLINNRLKVKRGKLYVAFIDFQKAFDTVVRDLMLAKIWDIGIRGRMHTMIREIYRNTKAEVQIGSKITMEFSAEIGVRQGCALSSVLFDIFIDDMDDIWIRKKEGGTVIGKVKIRVLKYADDIAVIAESAPR